MTKIYELPFVLRIHHTSYYIVRHETVTIKTQNNMYIVRTIMYLYNTIEYRLYIIRVCCYKRLQSII